MPSPNVECMAAGTGGLVLAERASLSGGERIEWKLRERGNQVIACDEIDKIEAFENRPGLALSTQSDCVGRPFSYLRGEFSLLPNECVGKLRFSIQLELSQARGVVAIAAIYSDPGFREELMLAEQAVPSGCKIFTADLVLDFRRLPPQNGPVFGFVQVCLPTAPGARVAVGEISASTAKGLRIRFDPLGDITKASSRLRVWKFIDLLKQKGHDVRIGGTGVDVDIYVCQKVRPFGALADVRKINPRAVIVYDFDDNFILKELGTLTELLGFINQVDLVTCGSEYLARTVRQWHPNVYVLENPLDVRDATLCRAPRGRLARVGWFGAPEGLPELTRVGLDECATTLTQGGDLEFDLSTVDENLLTFDLLVFPVEETPWNLAKNANRMMKALALGIPVLASATPEQTRIAALTGLPKDCLVDPQKDWKGAIERVRAHYEQIEQAALRARETLWKTHSPETILNGWWSHLTKSTSGLGKRQRASSGALSRIGVLIVDGSPDGRALATIRQSQVDWSGFHAVHVFCAKRLKNEVHHLRGSNFHVVDGIFLEAFERADRLVAESQAEYLLVIPAGVALAFGMAGALEERMEREPVSLFVRNEYLAASRVGEFGAPLLRELFLNPGVLGPLLVKTSWAREHARDWQSTYDLWPWAAAIKALAIRDPLAQVELPFAFDALESEAGRVPEQYAAWLVEHQPDVGRDLASSTNQWQRMLVDIVSEAAQDVSGDLPGILGNLHSRYLAATSKLASVEKELRELKQKYL